MNAALLKLLCARTVSCSSSGITYSQSDESAPTSAMSESCHCTRRPARNPPACILVRPWKTIITSLPKVRACSSCPFRSPSPAATISTIETIPQAIPNIVRNVRSLCTQRVRSTSPMRSRKTIVAWTRHPGERKPARPSPVVIRKLVSFCCENRGDGARPFLSAPGVTPPRTSKKRTLGTGGTPFRHCSKGPPWFPPVPVPPIIISPGS